MIRLEEVRGGGDDGLIRPTYMVPSRGCYLKAVAGAAAAGAPLQYALRACGPRRDVA